jgi:hypothetical protein
MANLNGWGRGTWGQLEFGEGSVPITLTGLAGTSAIGGVGVNGNAVANVGGITATFYCFCQRQQLMLTQKQMLL